MNPFPYFFNVQLSVENLFLHTDFCILLKSIQPLRDAWFGQCCFSLDLGIWLLVVLRMKCRVASLRPA